MPSYFYQINKQTHSLKHLDNSYWLKPNVCALLILDGHKDNLCLYSKMHVGSIIYRFMVCACLKDAVVKIKL